MKDCISNSLVRQSCTSGHVPTKPLLHHSLSAVRRRPRLLCKGKNVSRKSHRCLRPAAPVATVGSALRGLKHSYARRGRSCEMRTISKPLLTTSLPNNSRLVSPQVSDEDDDEIIFEEVDSMEEDETLKVKLQTKTIAFRHRLPLSREDDDSEDDSEEDESLFDASCSSANSSRASCSSDSEEDDQSSVDWGEFAEQRCVKTSSARVSMSPHVRFARQLISETVLIPSHRDYKPEEKAQIWTSLHTLKQEAQRNRREWSWEGYDIENTPEEDEFCPDEDGNLVHPAHCSSDDAF